jgi:hypothetical protein
MIVIVDGLDCTNRGDLFFFFAKVQEHFEAHHNLLGFVWPPLPWSAHAKTGLLDYYHTPADNLPYERVAAPWPIKVLERTGPPADFVKVSAEPEIWVPANQVIADDAPLPVAPPPAPPPAPSRPPPPNATVRVPQ